MAGEKVSIEEIEDALHRRELCFYYQPRISFSNGRTVGAEALLRWIRSDGVVVLPAAFLPQAEESGFITDISAIMLPDLIADIEKIRKVRSDIAVGFNVSALDLTSPYLVKMLRSFTGERRLRPQNIQIEITETAVVGSLDKIARRLNELAEMGIDVVMDDFGTGYASIDVLSRLPFSAAKLDQGLVRRMQDDSKSTSILRSCINMVQDLRLKTVAEGIETEATYLFLMASGCLEAQGYWMSPPLGLNEFLNFLRRDARWPASTLSHLFAAWDAHSSYRRQILDLVQTLVICGDGGMDGVPSLSLHHTALDTHLEAWGIRSEALSRLDVEMRRTGHELMAQASNPHDAHAIIHKAERFLHYSQQVDAEITRLLCDGLSAEIPNHCGPAPVQGNLDGSA